MKKVNWIICCSRICKRHIRRIYLFFLVMKLFIFISCVCLFFLVYAFTEARAEIVGPPIRYLTPGSPLKLMCRIVQNTETSLFIFWYHDNRMINYDVDRGINVSTEAGKQFIYLLLDFTLVYEEGLHHSNNNKKSFIYQEKIGSICLSTNTGFVCWPRHHHRIIPTIYMKMDFVLCCL